MDSMILACAFASAVAISACVVLLFSAPIDEVVLRLVPGEMAQAWCQYVKFGLFTVSFAGGMRLTEIAAFVAPRSPQAGQPAITSAQALLEVLKSVAGSLLAASATLFAFYISTLTAYALLRVYQSSRSASAAPRPAERTPHRSAAAERHAELPM